MPEPRRRNLLGLPGVVAERRRRGRRRRRRHFLPIICTHLLPLSSLDLPLLRLLRALIATRRANPRRTKSHLHVIKSGLRERPPPASRRSTEPNPLSLFPQSAANPRGWESASGISKASHAQPDPRPAGPTAASILARAGIEYKCHSYKCF